MLRPTKDNEKFSFREESEDFGPEMEFQYNNDTAVLAVLLYPQTAKAAATSRCRSLIEHLGGRVRPYSVVLCLHFFILMTKFRANKTICMTIGVHCLHLMSLREKTRKTEGAVLFVYSKYFFSQIQHRFGVLKSCGSQVN
jgi:hypothetical protein